MKINKWPLIFLVSIVVFFAVGRHPRVTNAPNGTVIIQSMDNFHDMPLMLPMDRIIVPVQVSELGFFDALVNLMYLFIAALFAFFMVIYAAILGVFAVLGSLFTTNWANFFLGILLVIMSPLAMLLPIVEWIGLILQPNGTIIYYVTIGLVGIPALISGLLGSSSAAGYVVLIFRR